MSGGNSGGNLVGVWLFISVTFAYFTSLAHLSRHEDKMHAAAEIVFDASANDRLGMFQTPYRSAPVLEACTDLPGVEFCFPCQLDYLCVYRAEGTSWAEVRPMVLSLLGDSQ